MPNGTYGGVRGRKTKVGRKLLRFPPTRFHIGLKYNKTESMIRSYSFNYVQFVEFYSSTFFKHTAVRAGK